MAWHGVCTTNMARPLLAIYILYSERNMNHTPELNQNTNVNLSICLHDSVFPSVACVINSHGRHEDYREMLKAIQEAFLFISYGDDKDDDDDEAAQRKRNKDTDNFFVNGFNN
jgi:hypothetical protein